MIRQNNVYKETIDFQIYLEKKTFFNNNKTSTFPNYFFL